MADGNILLRNCLAFVSISAKILLVDDSTKTSGCWPCRFGRNRNSSPRRSCETNPIKLLRTERTSFGVACRCDCNARDHAKADGILHVDPHQEAWPAHHHWRCCHYRNAHGQVLHQDRNRGPQARPHLQRRQGGKFVESIMYGRSS